MVGIKDKNLSEKLQTDPELTLKKAVDLLRQSKAAKRQKKTFDNATTVLDIDATVDQDRRIDENGRPRPSNRLANVPGCKSAFFTKSAKT